MAVSPAHRPSMVSRLGTIRLNDGPLKRGRLRRRKRGAQQADRGRDGTRPGSGCAAHQAPSSAITVSPPIMVWPTATSGSHALGQIQIGAAAEADDAEALAGAHHAALVHVAQDAPRDQPGDLHHRHVAPVRQAHRQRVALVVRRSPCPGWR